MPHLCITGARGRAECAGHDAVLLQRGVCAEARIPCPRLNKGQSIERMGTKIFLYGRFAVLMFLMGSLSPAPPAVSARSSELAVKLASLSGELRIVIQKSRNVLTLYKGMTPVRSYWAALGKGYYQGDKNRSGDKRTPEGHFYICSMNNSERFYKFMGISYPSIQHAEKGMMQGLITYDQYREIWNAITELRQPPWDTALGGAIGIHGRIRDTAV